MERQIVGIDCPQRTLNNFNLILETQNISFVYIYTEIICKYFSFTACQDRKVSLLLVKLLIKKSNSLKEKLLNKLVSQTALVVAKLSTTALDTETLLLKV